MRCHHIAVSQHEAEDGITLTVRTPGGKIFATAGGPTREAAESRLKLSINETLAGRVEDGLDPFSLLKMGEPGNGDLVLDELDLFPVVLRKLRHDQDLTQAGLAERLGVTQSAYSKLEQFGANPTLDTIRKLRNALGTPIFHFGAA